jgi:hypothetical protein
MSQLPAATRSEHAASAPRAATSHYLVEWYQPAPTGEQFEPAARRIDDSVATLSREGAAVELLLTLFLPGDEVAFCLFAAPSYASVEQACRRADLPFDRIGQAITCPQLTRSAHAAHPPAALSFTSPVPGYRGPARRRGAAMITSAEPRKAEIASPFRRGAFRCYQWVLLLFLLAGVVQIFLAGLGIFSLHGQEVGAAGETALNPHRTLGFALGGAALVIAMLAVAARAGARAIVLSFVLLLLTGLVQSLLVSLADDHAIFGGLHAADGLLILGTAAYLYFWSRRRDS